MPRPSVLVEVDGLLQWVLDVPESITGEARAATPDDLAEMTASFDAFARVLAAPESGFYLDALTHHVGHLVRAALRDARTLPDLPLIGEPFGGQGGTD